MRVEEALIFVNLRTFLAKSDLIRFSERVFFHKLKVLTLENQATELYRDFDLEMVVDQHFLEYECVRCV